MVDIKSIRKKAKLTQIEFADYFGITQGYLSELENGKQIPKDELLSRINKYAFENDISIEHCTVQDSNVLYGIQKKSEADLDFVHASEMTYRVNDYNVSNRYLLNTLLYLKKVHRIILGREYVFWLKGDPVAYIGKFGPAAGDNYTLIVEGLTEQDIPKDSVDAAYIIVGESRSNI